MHAWSPEKKKSWRALLFKHQDGLAICNTISVLEKLGVFDFFQEYSEVWFDELLKAFPTLNAAYLNVGLRSLASQGLFSYTVDAARIHLKITNKFLLLERYTKYYIQFSAAYSLQLKLLKLNNAQPFILDQELVQLSRDYRAILSEHQEEAYFKNEVAIHLEAVLLLPVLVYINYYKDTEDLALEQLLRDYFPLIEYLENLFLMDKGKLTDKGRYLFDKSYAYGVTTSYLPIMRNVESYLTGEFKPFFERDQSGNERHVFRGINVWGSGGSHSTYFRKIDEVLLDVFNRPLEQQPKGIIDVGCGNGALLEHIFNLIWNQTNRREDLDKNKLILIGADYNKEALLSTQRNLKKADVWAEVVWGDIGNPAEINDKLEKHYQVKLKELLNIRSFLDHNRPFNPPVADHFPPSSSTGAFAHRGNLLSNGDVEQSLVEHLLKWKPYVQKHGLLLIELHTIDPNIVQLNLGKTPCTAYDVTHGFSDQYIVEVAVFNRAVKRAGLRLDNDHYYRFPNSDLTTVTINLIS